MILGGGGGVPLPCFLSANMHFGAGEWEILLCTFDQIHYLLSAIFTRHCDPSAHYSFVFPNDLLSSRAHPGLVQVRKSHKNFGLTLSKELPRLREFRVSHTLIYQ